MGIADSVALVDVVLALRQRLIDAQGNGNQEDISKLLTTFGVLVETSYQYEKPTVTELFVSLEDAARNAMMNVGWKASAPTPDQIKRVLD